MSFMTLQIMHYGQEQSGDSKHNRIDFSLMATNNDISLDPGEEQDGLWGPRARRLLHALRLKLMMPFKNIISHTYSTTFAYIHIQVIIFSHLAQIQTTYTHWHEQIYTHAAPHTHRSL